MRFAGQYYDNETGLHYNWNRYYDPELGRYLRADPIGLEGGTNPYLYVNANAINNYDRRGLKVEASCRLGTGGYFVLSIAFIECTLKEDCKGGVQRIGVYKGKSGGFSLSLLPASYVRFKAEFPVDDMSRLTGPLDIVGTTIAGIYGKTNGNLCLNNHCAGEDMDWSTVWGIDLGFDFFINGDGRVSDIREECCPG